MRSEDAVSVSPALSDIQFIIRASIAGDTYSS